MPANPIMQSGFKNANAPLAAPRASSKSTATARPTESNSSSMTASRASRTWQATIRSEVSAAAYARRFVDADQRRFLPQPAQNLARQEAKLEVGAHEFALCVAEAE